MFHDHFKEWDLMIGGKQVNLWTEMSRTGMRLKDETMLRRGWEGQIRWLRFVWQDVMNLDTGAPVPLVVGERRR